MPPANKSDLRGAAKDFQRDKNHKAKWALGAVETPAAKCGHNKSTTCDGCAKHPRKPDSHYITKTALAFNKGQATKKGTIARKAFRHEVVEGLDENDNSDSSASDEVVEQSAAPAPAAEVMYSFDSHAGPGRGSQILSHAINQAVTRFENNETDKIVKEYDLVLDGKDELEFADAEDDFELVDASQLI